MKWTKKILLNILILFIVIVSFGFSMYLYAYWDNTLETERAEKIASRYMEEVYSIDSIVEGVYLNDLIDENYSDQTNHSFLMGERTSCIFGVNSEGKEILLIKTWRVFSRNFVIELDNYYKYDEAIAYIQSIYNDIEEDDITIVLTSGNSSPEFNKSVYIAYLVDHGDSYSRFILCEDRIIEIDGDVAF